MLRNILANRNVRYPVVDFDLPDVVTLQAAGLTGEAGGLKGDDVGKIEIHDRISYVAVRKDVAQHALKSLLEGKIKGRTFKVMLLR